MPKPPAILVFGLDDPLYLNLLPHLSQRNRCHLLLADQALIDAAARVGIAHEPVEGLLPPDIDTRVMGAQLKAAEMLWRPDLDACLASHFRGRDGTSFWGGMRDEVTALFPEAIREGVYGVELARHLVRERDLRAALCGYDMIPFARTLVAELARHGRPSVHVPHGLFGRRGGPPMVGGCGQIHASCVAAPGAFSADVYVENGEPRERVVITGAPRLDLLPTLRARGPAETRRAFGLDPDRPLVLFATTWVEWGSSAVSVLPPRLAPTFRALVRGLRACGEPRPYLVIKFHPTELDPEYKQQIAEGYSTLCRAEGLEEVGFAEGNRLFWLAAADLVVGMNSTIALEAVLAGRTAMNVPAAPEYAHEVYEPDSAVLTLPSPDAVEAMIVPALRDEALRARLAARRVATVERYNLADDGGAAGRVAELVLGLAGVGKKLPAEAAGGPA
jgi:hypothetical protein